MANARELPNRIRRRPSIKQTTSLTTDPPLIFCPSWYTRVRVHQAVPFFFFCGRPKRELFCIKAKFSVLTHLDKCFKTAEAVQILPYDRAKHELIVLGQENEDVVTWHGGMRSCVLAVKFFFVWTVHPDWVAIVMESTRESLCIVNGAKRRLFKPRHEWIPRGRDKLHKLDGMALTKVSCVFMPPVFSFFLVP